MKYSIEDVLKVLSEVKEPESGKDLVSLNAIKDLVVEEKKIAFTLNLESGGPFLKSIEKACKKLLRKELGEDFEIDYRKVKNLASSEEWFIGAYFDLEKGNKEISLQIMRDWLTKRKESQPLNLPNAGSVFKNPKEVYAARLIELCGLKGYRIGGACVSEKHANFIVNDKNATATDIENLIQHVAGEVKQQTGIELVREVKIL